MSRLGDDRGSALITAMLVLVVTMLLGFGALQLADGQNQATVIARQQESRFNLADGLLQQQIYLIARAWPSTAARAFPTTCSADSATTLCPQASIVNGALTMPDYRTGTSWTTQVQDDGGTVSDYYTTAGASTQPGWDANADGRVWVRAQALVRGRMQAAVMLVQANIVTIPFPQNVVTAGYFQTSNQGRKVIVDTKGGAAQPAPLAVRCTTAAPSACLSYQATQVSPDTSQRGYSASTAMTSDELNALRTIAQQQGTYYASGCPANPSGTLVFVESGDCSYGANVSGTCCNSAAAPGMFVVARGTFTLTGNLVYRGLVYAANLQNSSGIVVSVTGTAEIIGAVAVDGTGGVRVGASATNLVYDPNAFQNTKGFMGATPVQGTWRTLAGNR